MGLRVVNTYIFLDAIHNTDTQKEKPYLCLKPSAYAQNLRKSNKMYREGGTELGTFL